MLIVKITLNLSNQVKKSLTIWITGALGQLGNELRELSVQHPGCTFLFTDREDLPIEDEQAVQNYFESHAIDYCINAAAYTAVDAAEAEKETAYLINATAVGYLAKACKKHSAKFIHISTDYVFDGTNANGYEPYDAPGPQNVYGASKLAGELQAIKDNRDSLIIRTSWVYSSFGKNFVKTMMRLMQEKKEISVVNDQIGRPTYAADLAKAIFSIVFNTEDFIPGIFHFSNQGVISWYDFAIAIRENGKYKCKVHPIASSEYPTPAKRPAYSILKTDKIEKVYSIQIPNWRESLDHCMQILLNS